MVSTLTSPRAWLFVIGVFLLPTLRGTEVTEELAGLEPAVTDGEAADAADGPPRRESTTAGDAPVRLSTGTVTGIGHRGEGTVSLVALPGGERLVRLEAFRVDPGPDYRPYLVPGAVQESPGDGLMLGRLKGSAGDQNYPLPGPAPEGTVTRPRLGRGVSVPIAAATLG